jgi:hypothetical protein
MPLRSKIKESLGIGIGPIIVAFVIFIILLSIPIIPTTRVIATTETVVTEVTREVPEVVKVDEKIKVYVGFMEGKGKTITQYRYITQPSYTPPPGSYGYVVQQPRISVPYTTQIAGPQYAVDVDDGITDIQYIPKAGGLQDVTLINYEGRTVKTVRDVASLELNKIGELTVQTEKTEIRTFTEEESHQVTKYEQVAVRVNMFKFWFGQN